jgi:putative endonuclease
MYFVYAISSCARNYIYIGISNNPKRRLSQHNLGYNRTTKPYRPFNLILLEQHPSRLEARSREKYLKSGVGREFLRGINDIHRAGLSTDR